MLNAINGGNRRAGVQQRRMRKGQNIPYGKGLSFIFYAIMQGTTFQKTPSCLPSFTPFLCGFEVFWGTKSSANLNPTALAYSSTVDSLGDIFEFTFSRRKILLFCVWSLLASSSLVRPAFLRRPINFFLR